MNMRGFYNSTMEEFMLFNPVESIKKGTVAKKIPMERLSPFTRKINGFEVASYASGPKFRNGDTLLAKITPCLENGKTAFVDVLDDNEVAFGSSEFIVLREKQGVSNKEFVYYLAKSPAFRERAISCMEGTSGRKRVNDKTLKQQILPVPDITTQHRIAAVLSSLDAKIALNNRINDNLEAMAKTIYEYWFVQNADEKWEKKPIEEIADIVNGGTPSTADSENYGGKIVWITPKDLSNQKNKFTYYGERTITQKGYQSCNTTLIPKDSILLSSRAPIGLLSISKCELCTNQGFKNVVPKNPHIINYLYYYIQQHIETIQQLGAGTTFKEVSKISLSAFSILCPSADILEKWQIVIKPIFDKQFLIEKQNQHLTTIRDWLLPMLMNGQVSVNYHLSDY